MVPVGSRCAMSTQILNLIDIPAGDLTVYMNLKVEH